MINIEYYVLCKYFTALIFNKIEYELTETLIWHIKDLHNGLV